MSVVAGRIFRILVPDSTTGPPGHPIIIIEHSDVLETNDERLNMPLLSHSGRICFVESQVCNYIAFYLIIEH